MDRNTVIGLVLIGTILSVFTIMNQPSEEELAERQKELEQQEQERKALEDKLVEEEAETTVEYVNNWVPKLDENGKQLEENGGLVYTDTIRKVDSIFVAEAATEKVAEESTPEIKSEKIKLENEKLIITFDTKGGIISSVELKEYESYADFAKKDDKITALKLFKAGDAVNQLVFDLNGKKIETGDLPFVVKAKTDKSIAFVTDLGNGQKVEQLYSLNDDAYDLDYTINMKGFAGKTTPKNVALNWDVAYRKTERLFSEQRRVSTICYNYSNEGFDYLSEMTSDEEEAEDKIEWIAYKQSYFSSILQPKSPFAKDGSQMKSTTYAEGDKKGWTHLKDYSSTLNLGLASTGDASISMNWFFGPNDYEVLRSYDSGYDDILNFGWGIFRWINIYAVQPLFNWLSSIGGISVGIAILLLTIILKFVLMPIQWKMYTSSAKMRILKPEIDELNAKYPNKEDGMKKQMEMMTLYRESGASPLAGCVPMLVQMPILLAVFRFFPSAFELRQQSFLWAEDLSSYDSIWDFGVNIWPYGDHVSLFTLLMAGTTLIYTFINSSQMQTPQQPGMPNMKVIMYFFPIMMIFFFNNYSSGLSYYYFISTLMSIIIMILIKNFFVDEEKLKLKMAERKAARSADTNGGKVKKKSKFQERIEQMQKMQQEQMKNRKKK